MFPSVLRTPISVAKVVLGTNTIIISGFETSNSDICSFYTVRGAYFSNPIKRHVPRHARWHQLPKKSEMLMLIYLIYGPTCSGKTDLAIQIARETGWPVIALDRVQCCPQIATGSGRPLESELQSTQRIYLDSRPLTEGVMEAEAAHLQLISAIEDRKSSPGLILEGGSISLLNCMAKDSYWNAGFRWHVRRLRLATPDVFLPRARLRVTEMFAIKDERPSLLEELADLWNQEVLRPVLEDIDGYRCAIQFAKENNIEISELLHLDPMRREALIAAIAEEYLEHARWQEREFPDWQEGGNVGLTRLPASHDAGSPRDLRSLG